jgi:hypothetical protein
MEMKDIGDEDQRKDATKSQEMVVSFRILW